MDYKTWILEAWKGIFTGFKLSKIKVVQGVNFPGFLIGNSIVNFIFIAGLSTMIFTVLLWPTFWKIVWSFWFLIITILVSSFIKNILENYIEDYVYEKYYCKKRFLAGFLDLIHFYLAIFDGVGASLGRIWNGIISLMLGSTRMNAPCLPDWILKIVFLDFFYKTYMSFIYLQHVHNNPVQIYVCNLFLDMAVQRKHKQVWLEQKLEEKLEWKPTAEEIE